MVEGPELYFYNKNDGNYYSVEDIYHVLGNSINPNHDIYMDTVLKEFNALL